MLGGDDMDEFERLFQKYRSGVERFVKFRLPSLADAEDVLQEVAITASDRAVSGQKRTNCTLAPF